jgi:uncharacterized protein
MGQPVVHFEVVGKDGDALRSFYGDLFDWEINADNPMKYGVVDRESNLSSAGIGIGGGVAGYEEAEGGVTFYVEVSDVDAAIARAEELGGRKVMGAEQIMDGVEIGQFADPEGHVIGLLKETA